MLNDVANSIRQLIATITEFNRNQSIHSAAICLVVSCGSRRSVNHAAIVMKDFERFCSSVCMHAVRLNGCDEHTAVCSDL
jgi:hypothetical protein